MGDSRTGWEFLYPTSKCWISIRYEFKGWGGEPKCAPPPAMSCLSWNCRGVAAPATIRELQQLCGKYKPSIVFLSETKAAKDKIENLKRKLRFTSSFIVPSKGLSGGLDLLWNNSIEVDVHEYNQNYIHTTINCRNEHKDWECTFIYGNPRFEQRRLLWDKLSRLQLHSCRPWACLGDFNEILSQNENVGLQPPHNNCVALFREFLDENGLMDMDL
ncbi:Endonuclease/exonuclease/phosphatase [Sesbania bispinosa]|nr:Endonuclease/exonuclease/phosphatase [Sesbania bispinosa]